LAEDIVGAEPAHQPGALEIFSRLTRLQFVPLIIVPALVGTSLAFETTHSFNPIYFVLVLGGVVLLHLGANAIDDCYDYENGVDNVANSMFPKDFGGWKPLPRGKITLQNAKILSYLLLLASLFVASYFFFAVGPWSLILGASGVALAIIYTAPPLKLDYRGLGLGELSIFLAFGPIPVLGSYYVQTGGLSLAALLVSVPIGLLTVTILIDHDLIFYEVYSTAKKFSLVVVLGRSRSLRVSLILTAIAYCSVLFLVAFGVIPIYSLVAPIAGSAILLRKARIFEEPNRAPPYYVSFALNGMFANWIFGVTLAAALLL
jgi:1,4-dihydroxy-2-naphthoate polyprenyltransferase